MLEKREEARSDCLRKGQRFESYWGEERQLWGETTVTLYASLLEEKVWREGKEEERKKNQSRVGGGGKKDSFGGHALALPEGTDGSCDDPLEGWTTGGQRGAHSSSSPLTDCSADETREKKIGQVGCGGASIAATALEAQQPEGTPPCFAAAFH